MRGPGFIAAGLLLSLGAAQAQDTGDIDCNNPSIRPISRAV